MNLSVGSPPDWRGYRELWPRLDPLPEKHSIYTLKWPKDLEVPPVFLGQFGLLSGEDSLAPCYVYVFGFRLNFDQADYSDFPVPHSYFVEYAVVELPSEKTHWLSQRESTTYSSLDEKKDYIAAAEVNRADELSLGPRPRWKESEAWWPTFQGTPMSFVGQIALPENAVTRKFLTWDESIFLFWRPTGTGHVFKITEQNIRWQTAEEHYAMEQEEFDKL